MSKSTSGADLFRWAEARRRAASRKGSRWAPRRGNGFAAALAVVVEAGRSGVTAPAIRLSSASYRSVSAPRRAAAASSASRPQVSSIPPSPTAQPRKGHSGTTGKGVRPGSTPSSTPVPAQATQLGELFAQAPQVDSRCGTSAEPSHAIARCPRCGTEGEVAAKFGFRKVDGKRRAQSWCRGCRRTARTPSANALVEEAQQYARQSVREAGLSELPLWSSSKSSEDES